MKEEIVVEFGVEMKEEEESGREGRGLAGVGLIGQGRSRRGFDGVMGGGGGCDNGGEVDEGRDKNGEVDDVGDWRGGGGI